MPTVVAGYISYCPLNLSSRASLNRRSMVSWSPSFFLSRSERQEVFEPILKACKDAIAEMDDVGADVAVDILVNLSMACPVAIWDFCDSEGDGSGQSAANGTDTADQGRSLRRGVY